MLLKNKKKLIAVIAFALVGVIVLGTGSTYAAKRIAKNNSITDEQAVTFASVDAGVSTEDMEDAKVEFEFYKRGFAYEVEFSAGGVEYEYIIKASDGTILEKKVGDVVTKIKPDKPQKNERAVSGSAIEISTPDKISDADGSKSDLNKDKPKKKPTQKHDKKKPKDKKPKATISPTPAPTDDINASDEDKSQEGSADTDNDKGSKKPHKKRPSKGKGNKSKGSSDKKSTLITVSEAKSIALKRAGVSEGSVKFTEAKLGYEDGRRVYEIEFYDDKYEYEVEISARTGAVIDFDKERIENDDDDDDNDRSHGRKKHKNHKKHDDDDLNDD